MKGELILENGGWKRWLPAAAITILAEVAALWPAISLMLRRGVHGLMLQISTGVLGLVLWWVLYPALSRALTKGEGRGRVAWTLTVDRLTIGDDVIPLDDIRMVHCWPNRSALGTADGGLTVNIETRGRNRVLRSLRSGDAAAESERLLRELVVAMGYGQRLPEQES